MFNYVKTALRPLPLRIDGRSVWQVELSCCITVQSVWFNSLSPLPHQMYCGQVCSQGTHIVSNFPIDLVSVCPQGESLVVFDTLPNSEVILATITYFFFNKKLSQLSGESICAVKFQEFLDCSHTILNH